MRTFLGGFVLFCFLSPSIFSQVGSFPYEEQFDSAVPPSLPEDWLTTSNRLTTGDFFVTTTSPRSAPHAAQSTNSVISQSLSSPRFDFSGRLPDALQFFAARSGTHTSPLLIEASTDDGASFPLLLADTLYNPGTTSYTRTLVQLPPTLRDQPSVRFRWRVLGGSGGSTGTLRIDDVTVTTVTAIDLSVENLIVAPLFLNPTIPLDITLTVKNLGLTSASAYVVDLFLANKNETPDLGERFSSLAGPALPRDLSHLGNHEFPRRRAEGQRYGLCSCYCGRHTRIRSCKRNHVCTRRR
ncbi:MAG: hypothetical protein HYW57_10130 [Ignavibacteriales bacterium]|nr:hypothetical protein [Ignavibacteriales bacterium]